MTTEKTLEFFSEYRAPAADASYIAAKLTGDPVIVPQGVRVELVTTLNERPLVRTLEGPTAYRFTSPGETKLAA